MLYQIESNINKYYKYNVVVENVDPVDVTDEIKKSSEPFANIKSMNSIYVCMVMFP